MKTYFTSNPMKIGKHEWRVLVTDLYLGGRCTRYEWRTPSYTLGGYTHPASVWCSDQDWPTYDTNDTYHGLPRSLDRLYRTNEAEIRAHLDGMTLF